MIVSRVGASGRLRASFAGLSAILATILSAIVLAACEGGGAVVALPTGTEGLALVTASIESASTNRAPFVGTACVGSKNASFDFVVTASSNVNLHSVTIQMIDGTNLGGPMIPVPDAEMRRQVGNTLIIGGTTRRFRLSQRVPCGGSPKSVVASLGFVDGRGRTHNVSASGAY